MCPHYAPSGAAFQVLVSPPAADLLERSRRALDLDPENPAAWLERLPFGPGDTTAGAENELQTAVVGERECVDLPRCIIDSPYYRNLERKAAAGDTPVRRLQELNAFITGNPDRVWEHSWVQFPKERLNAFARSVFETDLLADKRQPLGPCRSDCGCFACQKAGENLLRLPLSYVLKLSLADAIGDADLPAVLREAGTRLLGHFLNDNTSPETFSFFPVPLSPATGNGRRVAAETLQRFLLSHLLVSYANQRFDLDARGQHALIYFSPHPPIRQRRLNELISDSFYRDLFMNPCLSGWDRGEDKHAYMALCHRVLSRSQLNAVARLKEAGIIANNLVVLPSTSNISLANNGTHLSLGSRRLSSLRRDGTAGFGPGEEKHLGDLVLKIGEHFLPLFVGTYSAAPYRLDFQDLHPEKAMGFLPHELHDIHLRMIWRRWRRKADIQVFGKSITPFGPEWLDRFVSRACGLRGDLVRDFRLIDYLVSVMSTDESPAMDGTPGNDARLKRDLAAQGVFHAAMPLYLLHRLRLFAGYGFCGFEGRHYSQFADILEDMGRAADLQWLVTALAYREALSGRTTHADIPDAPVIESERRQVIFGSAIGIPTFFVLKQTANRFLLRILQRTAEVRPSRRYPGYLRVRQDCFRQALLTHLRTEAADLIEALQMEETVADLALRLDEKSHRTAADRLLGGILGTAGAADPMRLTAAEFNGAAERYYRTDLRRHHLSAALDLLRADLNAMDDWPAWRSGRYNAAMLYLFKGRSADQFVVDAGPDLMADRLSPEALKTLILALVLTVETQRRQAQPDSMDR
jgi:hypothetical protein